jgi:hypothetical protein
MILRYSDLKPTERIEYNRKTRQELELFLEKAINEKDIERIELFTSMIDLRKFWNREDCSITKIK